ncbi:MAG: sulfatase [Opitutales bacterium]
MPHPPPNILFLFPDQWRGDWIGAEGKVPVRTPNLDALCQRGTRFTQCRSNAPVCIPSRACLAQGVRYHRCGCPNNSYVMDAARPNLFKQLREAGYRTLTSGKCDVHAHREFYSNTGWDAQLGRLGFSDGIDQRGKLNSAREPFDKVGAYVAHLRESGWMQAHMDDYARRAEAQPTTYNASFPTPLPRQHYTDDFTGRSALELLRRTPAGAPWYLWVNFPGPHDPWDAPAELLERTRDDVFPEPVNGDAGIDHQAVRRNYAAMVAGLDDWVGWLIDAVRQRGELDNTLIVFASDHGEMLGDHGRWTKSIWYEPSVRVPCILAGPEVPRGAVDERLVELIDVNATILEAAGLAISQHYDARSVFGKRREWQHSALHFGPNFKAIPSWDMAFDGRWKAVTRVDDEPLLFDLQNDPEERRDCAVEHPAEVQRLRALIEGQMPAN